MKNFLKTTKKQNGYAILFAVVVISSISIIVAGLTSTALKQVILSSLAKDSQIAFYQADTASDCAFYAEMVKGVDEPDFFKTDNVWSCGGQDLIVKPGTDGSYDLIPIEEVYYSDNPCFKISVVKSNLDTDPPSVAVNIKARGYNVCDNKNPKIVEREVEINY